MRLIAWGASLLVLLLASPEAQAFCRSTTCTGSCDRDLQGCKLSGHPLAWPGLCVGFSLQKDGTTNLPMEQVRPVIEDAFVAWSDLDCAKGKASIAFSELADVSCHASEFNKDGANANIVLFQDTKWRFHGEGDTLAKTTVTFDAGSGDILDADLEINFAFNELTVGDDHVVYDLRSIVTHEIGHFIGIDHSDDIDATMYAGYDEGSTEIRSLEVDDITAACTVYPPNRGGECKTTPRGGLGDACGGEPIDMSAGPEGGCALAPLAASSFASSLDRSSPTLGWLSLGIALLAQGRRRKRRP